MRSTAIAALILLTSTAGAQPSGPVLEDDVPLDVYLQAIERISPAAREGAEAYMQAFQTRCDRVLRTVELRRAMAEGDGDPTLMAMIGAAYRKNTAAMQRLPASLSCPEN